MDIFTPTDPKTLTHKDKLQALESLIFLEKKHSREVKGCICTNGTKQQEIKDYQEETLPKVMIDSVLITSAIKAAENCKVTMIDLPGAFLHAKMDDVVHMVHGKFDELMVKLAPNMYIANMSSTVLRRKVCFLLQGTLQMF